jgi:hypothetical protein
MHRTGLAIGVVMILAGVFLFNQGTQLLVPIAETAGLTSHYVNETAILPPTLFSVPSSNYTFATANLNPGMQVTGSLQVSNARQVAFYVMDEGNFSLWRQGRPSTVLLAQPVAISYNFTFSPPSTGTYFFIFDNQNNGVQTVIFSLSAIENVTVLSPFVQYAGFELLLVGIVLSYLSLRGGKKGKQDRKEQSPEVSGWKCKYCGTVNSDLNSQFCSNCGRSRQ